MTARRILILGGYGNFGKRIVQSLSDIAGINLLIAGRNYNKAEQLCGELNNRKTNAALEAITIDITAPNFEAELELMQPDLVIHTGGPFQRQDYRVPKACIAISSHYIDLADDRQFVCGIDDLDNAARASDVFIVSGASSVPGLSSTVIDKLMSHFLQLDVIDFAIAPGNRAERGEATVRGILSYTGQPFPVFHKGQWVKRYGWMSPRRLDFGHVIGKRWLANIDIPDLQLFPQRYKPVHSVTFQAGLELSVLHWGMVLMAGAARIGLIKDWSVLTNPIFKSSEVFKNLGTATGGMQINLSGLDQNRKPVTVKWTLCAENGVGPYIPTLSAIILAKKLISGNLEASGATPCLGLYTIEEFDKEAVPLGIYHQTETING